MRRSTDKTRANMKTAKGLKKKHRKLLQHLIQFSEPGVNSVFLIESDLDDMIIC